MLHYNCLSRAISVLTDKIFGIPILAYFDALGALNPERIAYNAIGTFRKFIALFGYFLKDSNKDLGGEVLFPGAPGQISKP